MITRLKRPPYIGIAAFLLVFIVQGLGHTQMILMEHYSGDHLFQYAFLMGLAGAGIVYWGVRANARESLATWLGFIGGTLIWDGWVEFSYVFYAQHLGLAALEQAGRVVTKPEYLLMPSSAGVLLASLVYFLFNRETRCSAFRWIQRNLHLPVGRPTPNYRRNVATTVAMETLYVIWFFYVFLLVIYDERILGDDHWAMYPILFGMTVWAIYLLNRLRRFRRLASAFRYAIPTAIISWNVVEIMGRWNLFTQIWVHPADYKLEMAVILGAFLTVAAIFARFPTVDPEGDNIAHSTS